MQIDNIETGRWQNVARENRKCLICNSGDIGDEFHYIFICAVFNDSRKQLLEKKIYKSTKFVEI